MALILSRWLNSEVGLSESVSPDCVDEAFRTGHLFAELLQRRGVPTPDATLFSRSAAPTGGAVDEQAAIHNYSLLEPVLQSIGVPISARLAADIIRGKPGAAVRTIYAIRSALFTLTGGSSDDAVTATAAGTMVLNQTALLSQQKKRFHQKEHEFFVEQLRRNLAQQHGAATKSPTHQQHRRSRSPQHQISVSEVSAMKQRALEASLAASRETRGQEWRRETQSGADMQPVPGVQGKLSPLKTTAAAAHSSDQAFLQRVKAEHDEQQVLRLEQDQRRARLLQEQVDGTRMSDAALYKKIMAERLLKQSKQEQRIAEQLQATKQEKAGLEKNRVEQDQQFAQLRDEQLEATLQREHAIADQLRADYQRQLELYQSCYADISHQHKLQTTRKHEAFCAVIVHDLISYALMSSEYATLAGSGQVPAWKANHLKCLFLKGMPMDSNCNTLITGERVCESRLQVAMDGRADGSQEDTATAASAADLENSAAAIDEIDRQEFLQYLQFTDRWTLNEDVEVPSNEQLAQIVDKLLNFQYHEPKAVIKVPEGRHLKLCLLGKPLSGKQIIRQAVADIYDLHVIDPAATVASLQTSTTIEETSPWYPLQTSVRAALLNGGGIVDDQLLTDVVCAAIREVEQQHADAGWVLCNFPQTVDQARLLEKAMRGYEEPKPVKPGNIRKSDKDAAASKKKSLISSSTTGDDISSNSTTLSSGPVSIFDAVLHLDVADAEILKRAAGGLVDPLTGKLYHAEYDPPEPSQQAGLEQLVQSSETLRSETLVQSQLLAFNQNLPDLRSWYERFQNFQPVDAAVASEELVTLCTDSVFKPLIEKKNHSKDANNTNGGAGDVPADTATAVTAPLRSFPSEAIAGVLSAKWIVIESAYTDAVKYILRGLRREDENRLREHHRARVLFKQLISLEDSKQQLVDAFVKEFNSIEDDFIADVEVKNELHLRTDELRERLWEIADARREDADLHRQSLVDSRWIEDHAVISVNFYIALVQAELERYCRTRDLVVDYCRDAANTVLDDTQKPAPVVARLDASKKIGNLLEDLLRPKKETASRGRRRASVVASSPQRRSAAARNSIAPEPASSGNGECMGQLMEAISIATRFISEEEQAKLLPMPSANDALSVTDPATGLVAKDGGNLSDGAICLRVERQRLGHRLDSITQAAHKTLAEIIGKARDLFISMEESSASKYQTEMEQIKALYIALKARIESEQRFSEPVRL